IGAVIGFAAAKLVSGQSELEVFLLFLVLFLALYLFTVSYTLMSLFITMLIAFMYDLLLGGISLDLMGARVLDTIAGAVIAFSASALVLPKKTKDKVGDALDDFFNELQSYISVYLKSFMRTDRVSFTDQAFDLDQKLQAVKDEAASLLQRPGALTRSGIGRWMTVTTAINYYAKHLLASANRKADGKVSDQLYGLFEETEDKLSQNIESLRTFLKGEESRISLWSLSEERSQIEKLTPSRLHSRIDVIHHLYYVWRINQSILAIGKEIGAEITEEKGEG
ncbi:FUSC family protein, partial [Bacillus haikouensis]|uniref:FUSC family protein n=1 Tax=Bacillus haikouensis TaxID=1510468 RepID=UPI001553E433|nr:FUSC family protein [Bacillus haikouensis]